MSNRINLVIGNVVTIIVGAFPIIYYYGYKFAFVLCYLDTDRLDRRVRLSIRTSYECLIDELNDVLIFPHYIYILGFVVLSIFLIRKKTSLFKSVVCYVVYYALVIASFFLLIGIFSFA